MQLNYMRIRRIIDTRCNTMYGGKDVSNYVYHDDGLPGF